MRVRNSRVALLSDYEVLSVMREMDRKMQERAAAAAAAIATAGSSSSMMLDQTNTETNESRYREEEKALQSLPSNLRSIQYKVLETLTNLQRPCAHQDATKIPSFMDTLSAWERGRPITGFTERYSDAPIEKGKRLTKGERLMLVNHAPTTLVELHALVEEIEERFTAEEQSDLLAIIELVLPLDKLAMQREEEKTAAVEQSHEGEEMNGIEGGVYVGDYDQEIDPMVEDDMDELENEARGEGAVDDEGKEDD